MSNVDQAAKIRAGQGFIAALDQSGGSSPKALRLYGIEEDRYSSDAEMFDLIHGMRERIVTSPVFTGEKVIGAILFEQTMDREFDGMPAAQFLWEKKGVVPFLKIDKGLEAAANGVQLMKPMPGLDATLARAVEMGIFGTKERSVIGAANAEGIEAIVAQQFEVGRQVLAHGLIPILEPEITISIPDKAEAEAMLRDAILKHLDALEEGKEIMLKLTLPEQANFYQPLVDHPQVMRVVALSGGYSREEANARLAQNKGVIASFSRALTEGLSDQQSQEEFDATLGATIDSIRDASVAG
ncbi:fructose bisphosphate aldolase [Jannaschia seohaensis]|uniref:fructose-bisphosphate aldolase n=1 Tax=Jannaschia seohaensis TaxID=475081 RepID=A0A2Y9AP17_9RHOB|nr:fructose bisphosphate aldolase [Jannaschia seohaensis]PWJ19164.1 fructose-bisphosphate aldolase class I [Jannaschia seohaensis]SSA45826.1 fructose-bisphosphate aldolase, class I [Jannaschia seohaensis]